MFRWIDVFWSHYIVKKKVNDTLKPVRTVNDMVWQMFYPPEWTIYLLICLIYITLKHYFVHIFSALSTQKLWLWADWLKSRCLWCTHTRKCKTAKWSVDLFLYIVWISICLNCGLCRFYCLPRMCAHTWNRLGNWK